jgi:HD-GYP domain-containing protein (c-di-GMP phosphodiesterase class II)
MDEHQKAFWQNHPGKGSELLMLATGREDVARVLRYHHERIDGRGYPIGLHGADIPLDARLLSVCEGWVALTSDRGYRPAMPVGNAWLVLKAGAGTQWDADIVQTLGRMVGAESAPEANARGSRNPAVA